MNDERVVETYREYELLSGLFKGVYKGRGWTDKLLTIELEGSSVENVLEKLKKAVDHQHSSRIKPGSISPMAGSFVNAIRKIMNKITNSQFAMLKSHFHSKNHRMTVQELAKSAGYKEIGGVNLWYGFLGQWIFENMKETMDLQLNADGTVVFTSVIATYKINPDMPGDWVWEMRKEVAEAIVELGLDN